jgi:hypothetical protein
MIGKIGERLAHIGLGRQPLALGADKGFEFGDQRFGALLADGASKRRSKNPSVKRPNDSVAPE